MALEPAQSNRDAIPSRGLVSQVTGAALLSYRDQAARRHKIEQPPPGKRG